MRSGSCSRSWRKLGRGLSRNNWRMGLPWSLGRSEWFMSWGDWRPWFCFLGGLGSVMVPLLPPPRWFDNYLFI